MTEPLFAARTRYCANIILVNSMPLVLFEGEHQGTEKSIPHRAQGHSSVSNKPSFLASSSSSEVLQNSRFGLQSSILTSIQGPALPFSVLRAYHSSAIIIESSMICNILKSKLFAESPVL